MKYLVLIFVFFNLISCVHGVFNPDATYDIRPVTVQTLSMFNQRTPSKFSKRSWKGDWILRRERLSLIDEEFRNIKPDLLIVQESISKKENASESDRNILLAGALNGYDWYLRVVKEYEDTQEVESMAVVAGLPLKINRAKTLSGREMWDIGHGGFLSVSVVELEGEFFTVFNIQMPSSETNRDLWYVFVKDRIKEKLAEIGGCNERVIVAGHLTGNRNSIRYSEFLNELGLKDSSIGYCEQENRCATATPINEIYMSTEGDKRPERNDRILVHSSAMVLSSIPNFNRSINFNNSSTYGLSSLWPTQRFGWVSNVRFAKCPIEESD